MSGIRCVDLGVPVLLEFRGPDAVQFLNGQITQDVRRVVGKKISLPSCVTDAKGKLQFRVTVTEADDGALLMEGPAEHCAGLEARITRYLIADDVEASDLTGGFSLVHVIGGAETPQAGVTARASNRFGIDGVDYWIPRGTVFDAPDGATWLAGDELEAFRIARGVPVWGRELSEGVLPPEAGLDETDVSYQKGCYIGQEVISRMKSAGKVNRRLSLLSLAPDFDSAGAVLSDARGEPAGEITSVSPMVVDGRRPAIAWVKRGVDVLYASPGNGGAEDRQEVAFTPCRQSPLGTREPFSPIP